MSWKSQEEKVSPRQSRRLFGVGRSPARKRWVQEQKRNRSAEGAAQSCALHFIFVGPGFSPDGDVIGIIAAIGCPR